MGRRIIGGFARVEQGNSVNLRNNTRSFESRDFLKAAQVPFFSRKLRRKINPHQIAGEFQSDNARAQHKHIDVIMLDALVRGVTIVTQTGANSVELIRGNRRSHAASADQNAPIGLLGEHAFGDRSREVGIIVWRRAAECSHIKCFMSEPADELQKLRFHFKSGVIGSERIVSEGKPPWGNFPQDQNVDPKLKICPHQTDTEMLIQTNGRCERANGLGDTYGPTAYEAYIPAYLITGWSGKWDDLPTAHLTVLLFDLLTILGLWFVGLRFGGPRLGAVLAFAWAAYPFTQYVSNSNTNDAIMPCLLVWAFWLVGRPVASGVLAAASGWTKFASLIAAPLWLTYPTGRLNVRFAAGFGAGTLAVFSIILLDPHPLHEIATFFHRTIGYQLGRDAPWSLWDWRQYHARGLPDLHLVQRVLQVALLIAAFAVCVRPRRKSPLQLVAFTAALLAGFEMVQTYWLYTYIPWFFPFAAIAMIVPATGLRTLTTRPDNVPVLDSGA